MSEKRLVNIRQAMEIAGCSRRTIYNWLALGALTAYRNAGGKLRLDPDSLLRPVKRRGVEDDELGRKRMEQEL